MKKLIAISVVFALVAGVAFAVDLGGTVIGSAQLIKADSAGNVGAGGEMKRVRIEGGGEVADGRFGGWLRFDGRGLGANGIAWWKPIDQIKVSIGGNPDGIWGKEGNSGWGFYQHACDTKVSMEGDHVWGNPTWGQNVGFTTRQAFYEGFGDERLFIEITPVDMVGIKFAIPFLDGFINSDVGKVFTATNAQIDLNMSFGNIAFSFAGDKGDADSGRAPNIKNSQIFAYFGLTAIDNLQMDFGLGTDFNDSPLYFGLALKYATDSWGIKFRSVFAIPLNGDQPFGLLFDILPYFVINESFRAYISGGIAFGNAKDFDHSMVSWSVNPYIEVGEEWGAKFLAGIRVYQKLGEVVGVATADGLVKFEIPVAFVVSF